MEGVVKKGQTFKYLLLSGVVALFAHSASNALHAEVTGAQVIGRYVTNVYDGGAAEIVAFDARGQRLFVVNGDTKMVDVLSIADPTNPTKVAEISAAPHGKTANSVAVHGDLVALAVEQDDRTAPGKVAFYTTSGEFLTEVEVGALPDMITFTPDGSYALVACEGEPSDDYMHDPEGSVAIIDLAQGVGTATVKIAGFAAWNEMGPPQGARLVKPGASVAEDFEPEYVAVSADSKTAWVSLQENNALAVVDIAKGEVTNVIGLGFKDHLVHGFDASNKDDGINIKTWPVKGMYQPDSIVAFEVDGVPYVMTANEGDAKDYDGWSEETRVAQLTLDPVAFPNDAELQEEANLGRLKTTKTLGDTDGDGDHDEIYAFGARSFSIWSADGDLIFDSGDDFERILADRLPDNFNSTDNENGSLDDRSDDKGPEPEAVTVGKVGDKTYAFIGLERAGGIMIYDVSQPAAPLFIDYVTQRLFDGNPEEGTAGDLAPEGMVFISDNDSPNGKPLLVVANEVSGSTTIYELVQE